MLQNGCSNFKVNFEVKSVCHVLLFFYVKTQEAQNEVAATNVWQNLNDDDNDQKFFKQPQIAIEKCYFSATASISVTVFLLNFLLL